MEAMQKYQDADSGSSINVEEFRILHPIVFFDVSKHSERLVISIAETEVTWTLGEIPGIPFKVFATDS